MMGFFRYWLFLGLNFQGLLHNKRRILSKFYRRHSEMIVKILCWFANSSATGHIRRRVNVILVIIKLGRIVGIFSDQF